MLENRAFITLLRRLLTVALVLFVLLFGTFLGLARHNRARSYQRGLNAVNQARDFWPGIVAGMETLRDNMKDYRSDESLLESQRFNDALDSLAAKQRERILVDGVKVSIYTRISLRTNHAHLVPIPGNTSLLKQERELWLPVTVEVIAAQKDILVSDFLAQDGQTTWALDPLELEGRLNANPGVISCALMINAPGGYERALVWIDQILWLLCSFLLIFVPAYVWQDARGRYRHALLWTSLVALTNIAGLLTYLLIGRVTATTCFECKQAVNEQQKFCPYCRVLLKTECLNCGQALGRNWRFCAGCGAKPERE